ncbi:hypothetical protein C0J52_19559, partial [Blattella germanica]
NRINLLLNKDEPSELSSSYWLSNKQSEFFKDRPMCKMINSDIPLYKVNNPHFKTFIEKCHVKW